MPGLPRLDLVSISYVAGSPFQLYCNWVLGAGPVLREDAGLLGSGAGSYVRRPGADAGGRSAGRGYLEHHGELGGGADLLDRGGGHGVGHDRTWSNALPIIYLGAPTVSRRSSQAAI
jgi:hypothetical protein